jgi:hypothetical protein
MVGLVFLVVAAGVRVLVGREKIGWGWGGLFECGSEGDGMVGGGDGVVVCLSLWGGKGKL